MDQQFAQFGVRFRYPGDWQQSVEEVADTITVTLNAPSTTYWSLSIFPTRPPVEQVIETAQQAFEDEYEDLERENDFRKVGPYDADGYRYEFMCLDLVNVLLLRAFRAGGRTLLLMAQGLDRDMEELESTIDEISDSLICDAGDDLLIN